MRRLRVITAHDGAARHSSAGRVASVTSRRSDSHARVSNIKPILRHGGPRKASPWTTVYFRTMPGVIVSAAADLSKLMSMRKNKARHHFEEVVKSHAEDPRKKYASSGRRAASSEAIIGGHTDGYASVVRADAPEGERGRRTGRAGTTDEGNRTVAGRCAHTSASQRELPVLSSGNRGSAIDSRRWQRHGENLEGAGTRRRFLWRVD